MNARGSLKAKIKTIGLNLELENLLFSRRQIQCHGRKKIPTSDPHGGQTYQADGHNSTSLPRPSSNNPPTTHTQRDEHTEAAAPSTSESPLGKLGLLAPRTSRVPNRRIPSFSLPEWLHITQSSSCPSSILPSEDSSRLCPLAPNLQPSIPLLLSSTSGTQITTLPL
ncbi:hypothetical protein Mapa_015664 [Marchantia paleacea]|nr:hypothetical protein Mapa_015664 [Marchantia paleacea]